MRHDWQPVKEGVSFIKRRRCSHCGKTQTHEVQQQWGRVTGYKWWPLVGRCGGKQPASDEPGGITNMTQHQD
jgi:hypothetical protein